MVEQTLEPTDTKAPAFTAVAATTGTTVWGYQTEATSAGITMTIADDNRGSGIIYDLRGRRVDNPQQPGIYIRNGKKFVVK